MVSHPIIKSEYLFFFIFFILFFLTYFFLMFYFCFFSCRKSFNWRIRNDATQKLVSRCSVKRMEPWWGPYFLLRMFGEPFVFCLFIVADWSFKMWPLPWPNDTGCCWMLVDCQIQNNIKDYKSILVLQWKTWNLYASCLHDDMSTTYTHLTNIYYFRRARVALLVR